MYKHMVNWELVLKDQAGFTPKGNEDVYVHAYTSTDVLIVVKGDRTWEPLYLGYYPYKEIPIYGF